MLFCKASRIAVITLSFGISLPSASPSFGLETDGDVDQSIFVTPTRLKQSPHDTPSSVSKITEKTIQNLQLKNVTDIFRYVAGMIQANASGNQPRVSYHGTNGLTPRRMQVLLNGISVYRPSYAEVTWPELPISINDISYVEIVRSPSAATYGANSMLAVINIVTKAPRASGSKHISFSTSNNDTNNTSLSVADDVGRNAAYRVGLSAHSDDGYDKNFAGVDRHDGSRLQRLNAQAEINHSDATTTKYYLATSKNALDLEFRDSGQQTFPDVNDEYSLIKLELDHALNSNHELKLSSYYTLLEQELDWRTCYPTIFFSENLRRLYSQNPQYAQTLVSGSIPTGGSSEDDALRNAILLERITLGASALSPTCGWVNEDGKETKASIQLQDTYIFNDDLRFVGGFEILEETLDNETFVGGQVSAATYMASLNAEYRFSDFLLNAGGLAEQDNDNLESPAFSPRVALNYRLDDVSTVRFAFSKAVRTPDIQENKRDWNYYMTEMTPPYPLDGRTEGYFYLNASPNNKVTSEHIKSREVSYYRATRTNLESHSVTTMMDVKFFYDSLDRLVSEKLQFVDFNPTNNGEVELKGVETEVTTSILNEMPVYAIEEVTLHGNVAYIDSDTDFFYERSLHANTVGAAYIVLDFENDWFSSLTYYGNSAMAGESFDAWEYGLGRSFGAGEEVFSIKGKVVYLPDEVETFTVSETFDVVNRYSNKSALYLTFDYGLDQ